MIEVGRKGFVLVLVLVLILAGLFLSAAPARAGRAGDETPPAWKATRLSPRVLVPCVEPAQRNNTVVVAGAGTA